MKITELKKVLKDLSECDNLIEDISDGTSIRASVAMKQCLIGGIIQRRATLLERLKNTGIDISEHI